MKKLAVAALFTAFAIIGFYGAPALALYMTAYQGDFMGGLAMAAGLVLASGLALSQLVQAKL